MIGALQEAVFSVKDIEQAAAFYTSVAGWEIIHRGRADQAINVLWNVPAEPIDEILLATPGTPYGYLRLLKFHNVAQTHIRTGFNAWDTGGFYNVNIRVHDAHLKFDQMRDAGWVAHSNPHSYDFTQLSMSEVMLQGPDGVCITLVERISPPLEGWQFTDLSHIYNATQIVSNYAESRRFFVDQLGFLPVMEAPMTQDTPGDNPFGLPHNIAPDVTAHLAIFRPPVAHQSTIEIIQLEGAMGEDFSTNAVPPNRGVLMLRFLVDDLETYHSEIVFRGVDVHIPPSPVVIAPYGLVQLMALRTPDGAWLEFLQLPT